MSQENLMSKIVMVISGAVTAFILALTAGAVYAYRSLSTSAPGAAAVANAQQPADPSSSTVQLSAPQTPTTAPNISPQDAASMAAKFLNRTDLYSVEILSVQGAQAYKVTFSSGDAAFVSLQGQVLSILPAPTPGPVTTVGGTAPQHSKGGGSAGGGGGESEGGDGE
jgi:hypothetical protein